VTTDLVDAQTARLKMLEADPSMRHTAARWDAYEAVYPGSGAAAMASTYREADAELLAEVRASLAVLQEKAPGDDATVYLAWMEAELAVSTAQTRQEGSSDGTKRPTLDA
jgi:hypothetical protein